jgi:hypothetical protein
MMAGTALSLVVQLIAGVIGANVARAVGGKNIDLGSSAIHSVVGAVGGVVGGQVIAALIPLNTANAMTVTELAGQAIGSLAAGALLMIDAGLFDKHVLKRHHAGPGRKDQQDGDNRSESRRRTGPDQTNVSFGPMSNDGRCAPRT